MSNQHCNNEESEVISPIRNLDTAIPTKYKVVIVNDDYTPMDFVVKILEKFFTLNRVTAIAIMWQIHTQGKAICGKYVKEIAETKVQQVNDYARINEYPLLSYMEKE